MIVAMAVLGLPGAVAAAPLRIVASSTTVDSGQQVSLRLRTTPAAWLARASAVTVTSSAGTLKPCGAPGRYVLVAPRLTAPLSVVVRATVRVGQRLLRARATVAVRPQVVKAKYKDTGGSFGLRVPSRLILGTAGSAEISIAATTPLPDLIVSRGTLGPLRRQGDRLVARYTPPSKTFPQLAIVAAVSLDRSKIDWVAIPLWGKARTRLRGEPLANVTVLAERLSFGPVRLDTRGQGFLHVAVPPGASELSTLAVDAIGNKKRGKLPLRAPPLERLLVICPKASARILALSVTPTGTAEAGRALKFTADRGSAVSVAGTPPGVYAARYTTDTPRTAAEPLTITVGDARDSSRCIGSVPSLPPRSAQLSVSKQVVVAGGSAVEVAVKLSYSAKLPPRQVSVLVHASSGSVSAVRRSRTGVWLATWRPPKKLAGNAAATITATVGGIRARKRVRLRAAAVTRARARLARTVLAADGSDTTRLTVEVFDRFGNPASATLQGTSRGELTPFARLGLGRYTARYTAPASGVGDRVSVSIAGRPLASVDVRLLELQSWALGGQLGYLSNLARVSGPVGSLAAEYTLPMWRRRLQVGGYVGFYSSSSKIVDAGMTEQFDLDVRGVPLLGRALLQRRFGRVTGFVGVGLGAVWLRTQLESDATGRVIDNTLRPAALGMLGGSWSLGPGKLRIELGYLFATASGTAVRGRVGGPMFELGYRYAL